MPYEVFLYGWMGGSLSTLVLAMWIYRKDRRGRYDPTIERD